MPDEDEPQDRRAVLRELIHAEPGMTTAELVRETGFARSVVRHHLRNLLAIGDVVMYQSGRNQHHFAPDVLSVDEQANLALLRQGTVRRVLLTIALEPNIEFGDLGHRVEVADSTLSELCTRLERLGLLERDRRGRVSHFRVADPRLLHALLSRIRSGLLDRLVDRFLDTWQPQ